MHDPHMTVLVYRVKFSDTIGHGKAELLNLAVRSRKRKIS